MGAKNIQRGDVYYIEGAKEAAGAEMVKTRPGIVISDQNQVKDSHVVTVVYLSHKEQTKNRAHVPMTHEGLRGVALCEHIYTVDVSRVGDYLCTLTDQEMDAVLCGVDSVIGGDPNQKNIEAWIAGAEHGSAALAAQEKETGKWKAMAETLKGLLLEAMTGGCGCGKK